jgi:Protein of unknown function (DUF2946)
MTQLRAYFFEQHRLTITMIALALLIKALVPAGYMIGAHDKVLTVEICGDASGKHYTTQIVIPHDAARDVSPGNHAKSDGACSYSALSFAALAGAPPFLLVLLLAFILATRFAAVRPEPPAQAKYLRPPLRGPPSLA